MSGSLALVPMSLAVAAGAGVPFQAASNAALGRALGHPLWGTLASLSVSLVAVAALLLIMRVPAPALGAAVRGPAWWWIGGVAGVVYITAALLLAPRLGVASFMVSVVAGQMLASLVIDHCGLMGLAHRPAGVARLAGVGLMLLGMVVLQMGSTSAGEPPGSHAAGRR